MATVAKGYDLDYAWRAVGEAYQGAGYYLAAAEAGEPPGTWWGPGAERLGMVAGQQVEREPYNLLFGQRKGPDGAKLGRVPANAGKAVEIYKSLVAAEPGADDHRRAVLRIEAQRQARQSPLYFDLTVSWSKDISIFHASLGAAVQRARDEGDKQAEALATGLLAEADRILRDANDAALAYVQREAGYVRTGSHVARVDGRESGQWREADLIVASWYQHTSRDGDMQLHGHNQIAHVAITRDDGKGRAPDSTAYYEHVRAAGQIASVHAATRLIERSSQAVLAKAFRGEARACWGRRKGKRCVVVRRCGLMALWLVRAGSRGEGEDYALQNNVVGIGWADLGDLSAARSLDAIKQHLRVFPNSDS